MKNFLIITLMFVVPSLLQGQDFARQVSGKVTDSEMNPLPGVSVSVPNTKTGVITAADGTYRIQLPKNAIYLSFSFVGMETQKIKLSNKEKTILNVVLKEKVNELDEVVAIGYGYVKKSDLTGSVASLDSKITEGRIVNNLEDALQGRVAGVQITTTDGTPGGSVDIKIRGTNSISASSSPLYVIDGIPYDLNETPPDLDFWEYGTTQHNPIANISPGDIESIEVLKDASATAIYGARGVNGVILIETKKGKEGRAKVDFTGNLGVSTVKRKIKVLDGPEYAKFLFDAYGGYEAEDNQYADWQKYTLPGATNTDWQDAIFRTALTQDYRINISGGTPRLKYSIMGNYYNQDGVIINSGYDRYSGRFNFSLDILRNLTFTSNLYASYAKNDGVTTGFIYGVITKALQASPLKTVEEVFAEMEDGDIVYNPVADTENSVRDRTDKSYQISMGLIYKIIPSLTLNLKGAYVDKSTLNEAFIPSNNPRSKTNGSATISDNDFSKLLGEATLSFYKNFNKRHRLTVMGGATIEKYNTKRYGISTSNFGIDVLGINNISMGNSVSTPTSAIIQSSMASFIGRVNYGYRDRYLATVTFRADGSSKFPEGNKFACFPSVALAWRLSEEEFLKSVDWISNIKIRTSFGVTGNQAIPAYESLGILKNSKITIDGANSVDGIYPDRIENRNLKWETTDQYNAGIDLGLFGNRFQLTVDAYYKKTRDLLLEMSTPKYSGFSSYWSNIGSIENKGLEFTLNTVNIDKRSFKWNSALNIALNRSKVLDLGPDSRMELSGEKLNVTGTIGLLQVGKPIGLFYGYKVEGIWQSTEEIQASGIQTQLGTSVGGLKPGYRKYEDVNNDHVIDDSDKQIIGYGEPLFTGGFLNTFQYKDFELSLNLQFSVGGDIFNVNRVMLENGDKSINQSWRVKDRFRPSFGSPGDEVYDPGQISATIKRADTDVQRVPSSDYIEDGSFLRISDITLGYNFRNLTKSRRMNLKVYLSAKNLHVFSGYLGYDPEVNTAQGGYASLLPGIDLDAYPKSATYSIGCSLSF